MHAPSADLARSLSFFSLGDASVGDHPQHSGLYNWSSCSSTRVAGELIDAYAAHFASFPRKGVNYSGQVPLRQVLLRPVTEDSSFQALCVEICDPRVRLTTLTSALSRCRVWSTFARRLGTLRRWSLCLESLHHKRRSAPLVRFCSVRHPATVHSSAQDRRVSVSASGCSRTETLFESAYDTRSRGCALWLVGTSRRRHVRIV